MIVPPSNMSTNDGIHLMITLRSNLSMDEYRGSIRWRKFSRNFRCRSSLAALAFSSSSFRSSSSDLPRRNKCSTLGIPSNIFIIALELSLRAFLAASISASAIFPPTAATAAPRNDIPTIPNAQVKNLEAALEGQRSPYPTEKTLMAEI